MGRWGVAVRGGGLHRNIPKVEGRAAQWLRGAGRRLRVDGDCAGGGAVVRVGVAIVLVLRSCLFHVDPILRRYSDIVRPTVCLKSLWKNCGEEYPHR